MFFGAKTEYDSLFNLRMMAFALSRVLLANNHFEPNIWPIRLN
jgi:hypothetical protein